MLALGSLRIGPRAATLGAALVIALSACAPAMTPDASLPDSAADVAPPDATTDSGVLGDAPTTCVNVAGSWEWVGTCSAPGYRPDEHTCLTQTGCTISENGDWELSVAGNVATRRLTMSLDGTDGMQTITFNGDTTMSVTELTRPTRATCRFMGRRGSFPGATSYCCDVSRASCGAGQRCVQVQAHTNPALLTSACVPNGTIAPGAACTRTMDRTGTDQCQGNHGCVAVGQMSATNRVCTRLCSSVTGCGTGEVCRWNGQGPRTGVCLPRCELLGTACQTGTTCRPYDSWRTGNRQNVDPVCDPAGPRTDGMPCNFSTECGVDLGCRWWVASPVCRRVCDDTHACPAGARCDFVPNGSSTNLGVCVTD